MLNADLCVARFVSFARPGFTDLANRNCYCPGLCFHEPDPEFIGSHYICAMNPKPEEIAALEQFFNSITLPNELRLNKAIRYVDLPFFVHTKLELLKEEKLSSSAPSHIRVLWWV